MKDEKEEIVELYKPVKEIVLYENIDRLNEKVILYLASHRQRIEIAGQGLQKSVKQNAYAHRLEEMFYNIRID